MIVDIHAHYFPKEYNDMLLRIGGRSLPEAARPSTARPMRNDDASGIPTRLKQMDEAEVQMQILSPPRAHRMPRKKPMPSRGAAHQRQLTPSSPRSTRPVSAVVSLPLPHIDASLREMERGLDRLGMLGVSMTCSCFDRSTAESEFEPLYAR